MRALSLAVARSRSVHEGELTIVIDLVDLLGDAQALEFELDELGFWWAALEVNRVALRAAAALKRSGYVVPVDDLDDCPF